LGSFHRANERIVAAGVEHDQAEPLGGLEDLAHPLQGKSLIFHIDVTL
jgi:hypothetical protein